MPVDALRSSAIATPEPLPPAPVVAAGAAFGAPPPLDDLGASAPPASSVISPPPFGRTLAGENAAGAVRRLGSIPELEAVAIKDDALDEPPTEVVEVTKLQERRLLDQHRFADLADHQRPWAFHGVATRLVGRVAELDALNEAWRTALQSGKLVLSLVTGPAGVGKTRLLDEFVLQLERAGRVFTRHQLSIPEGTSDLRAAVLEPLLRVRFGLEEELPPVAALAKLRRELAAAHPPETAGQLAFYFAHLLRIDVPGGSESRREAHSEMLETRAQQALVRWLVEETQRQNAIYVLDDLDRASLPTLQALFDWCTALADAPMLVVGLGSPELLTRPLAWLDESRRQAADPGTVEPVQRRIQLGPLSEGETRRLLESFLGHRDLPETLVALANAKSRGNPLALQQMLELLVEHQVLTRQAGPPGSWFVDATRLTEGEIPVSLEGLLEARLRQLPPEELAVLRQAAAQGSTFGLGGIMACARVERPAGSDEFWFDERLEEAVRQTLLELQGRDIIKFLRQGPTSGELQFEFRHTFEREWVYRACPDAQRALYHRMYAQWLQTHGDENTRPLLHEAVARHLEAGGALRRAAFAYLESARRAAAAYRNEEAIHFLRKVITYLTDDDVVARVDAHADLGRIHYQVGDYAASAEAYRARLRDCYLLGNKTRAAAAYGELGQALTDQGDFSAAEHCLTRALALHEELAESAGIASALDGLGQLYIKQGGSGSLDRAQRNFERSLKIRREQGDELGTALSYHLLGWVYTDRGFTREGRLCFREAIRLRAGAGDKAGLCRSMNNLAETYRVAGEVAKSRRHYEEAYRVAEEIGAQALQGVILGNLAECDLEEGKLAEARRRIEQALALSSALADRPLMVCHLVTRSKVRQQQGDGAGARQSAEEALRLLERLQGTEDLGPALRRLGEILAGPAGGDGAGDPARARDCFRRSIRVLSEAGNDLELARSMETYAAFLETQGNLDKSQRYLQRAQEILARMKRPEN